MTFGASSRDAVAPWTERVAELGAALVAARARGDRGARAAVRRAGGRARAWPAGELRYEAEPPTREALEARLDEDLERGTTGLGPHLDDVGIAAGGRDLRRFGSQGEQRLAVLSLLLAEAELLDGTRARPRRSSCSTTCSRSSTSAGAARSRERLSGRRADADHGDRRPPLFRSSRPSSSRSSPGSAQVKPERIGDEVQRRALALRPGGGDDGDRARVARGDGRADRPERVAGAARRGTESCTSRRRPPRGHSSSPSSSRSSWSASRRLSATPRPAGSALRPGKLPEPLRGGRRRAAQAPREPTRRRSASWRPRSPPGSRTKVFAKSLQKRPRRASRGPS